MRENVRELLRYRELILILVRRDLRVRYKNSVLGFFWSLAPLLLQAAVLTFVVRRVYGVSLRDLSAFILCAYIPWTFFLTGIMDGTSSVVLQYALMKKVYFPREVLPIASALSNGVHMLLALGVFVVYRYVYTTLVYGWPGPPPREVFWLPVLLLIAFFLVLGVVFITSTWNVFFEDIKFIVQNVLNLAFFLLPIMWFTEQLFYSPNIPHRVQHLLTIIYNVIPFSWLISAFRQVLLPPAVIGHTSQGRPMYTAHFDYKYLACAAVLSLLLALAGYAYFNRRKWAFVERA